MTDRDPSQAHRGPSPADALADQLERIAVGAVGLTTRALANAGAGIELTFPQWRVLLVLGEHDDGARIGEVAARVGVTLPATSRLLRRLERRGMTTLAVDELDRRATRARLTDEGFAVRQAILAHRRADFRDVASTLSTREQRSLSRELDALAAALERFA